MLRRRTPLAVAAVLLLSGCSPATPTEPEADPAASAAGSPSSSPRVVEPSDPVSDEPSATASAEPSNPVSLPAYFDREVRGRGLRLGAVRERTPAYTSYAASYRSGPLTITGVLNVPRGRGPFPAVVLAHGYIDPQAYVSGQGMTRERGYLASRGYVAFHVDYRNHAGSDADPDAARHLRLGYAVDVIAAVHALRDSTQVPLDDGRIALLGRSMGGGVVYKALEIAPGLVGAAAVWAPVSSLEAQNYNRWIRDDADRSSLDRYVARTHGLPGQPGSRRFWREVSARTYFDRITEPLLIVQGGRDDTCPPPWARASFRALRAAGADAQLAWYAEEGHAFGPRFFDAMGRTVAFLNAELA